MPRLTNSRLRAAIASGRVHHAYLFTGPTGAGKRATAIALACALNCERAPGEGCDDCDACARIVAGIHPDVVTLEREGAASIVPIEVIRREVIARVGLPPHEARTRVFIIDEANSLQPAAANSLLKTLEEPPARTMFVLGTVAPDQLLPTIRSRCQRVAFPPGAVTDEAQNQLADDVAHFEGGMGELIALAARVNEEKGAAAGVLDLAARRLHETARAAVTSGDLARARDCGDRARLVLDTWLAITLHNAHPQVAVEALLGKLGHP